MRLASLIATPLVLSAVAARGENVRGEYLEARNADVWTGPCFANAEMGIVGNKAVLAWKVTEGIHGDVRLDGLGVAAVVIGDRTFGIGEKVTTRAVLLVDARASQTQQRALVDLATSLAGDTIQKVVAVRPVPFDLQIDCCAKHGCARLDAGQVSIRTRCLTAKDCICGHEDLAYPALAEVQEPLAAFTLENVYRGGDFGETFAEHNARSAMIGHFAR